MLESALQSSFRLLATIPVLALTLLCGSAFGQPAPLTGSYAFGTVVQGFDTGDNNGGAFLGIINFDGAGGVTGTATVQTRDDVGQAAAPAIPTTISGTYTMNPDGTVAATVAFDELGFGATLNLVFSDGGQEFHFVDNAGTVNGGAFNLQGTAQSLTGAVPMALFLGGATGNIPVTLTGVTNGTAADSVFTAAPVSGSGPVTCPDGSTGTWNAAVASLTVIAGPDVAAAARGGKTQGDFLINVGGTACGDRFRLNKFGPMTGTVTAAGAANLSLRTFGEFFSGIGRVAKGGSLNGAYGFSLNFSPFPNASTGMMKFDGAGNATGTILNPTLPEPLNVTGTYTTSPDGSGVLNLKNAAGQAAGQFSFVITDGGSSFLVLGTGIAPAGNLSFGQGRLQ